MSDAVTPYELQSIVLYGNKSSANNISAVVG